MKKSTIIRLIALALTALFALSLVACGGGGGTSNVEKVTIYLDPNGGELDEDTPDEFQVELDTNIGSLPTPKRGGYKFLGWYEDGNEKWEVDRRTKAEYDMELVALWEPLGELVTVEFSLETDAVLSTDITYIEVVKDQRISTALKTLPTATREGYYFKGWKDANNNTVSLTTKVSGDLVLSAVWEKIVYCFDGTENHQWNAFQDKSEATCTQDATRARSCNLCGHEEVIVTTPATGHRFDDYVLGTNANGALVRSHTCVECEEVETDPLKNISFTDFQTPVLDGDCYMGTFSVANIVDGDFKAGTFCGKGTGAVTVTLTAKDSEGVHVDVFCVSGSGGATYTVSAIYADGTRADIGPGAFGGSRDDSATKSFEINAVVVSLIVTMPSPSNGSDYWAEIAACVVN